VKRVPSHGGMARPQVANARGGLQVWRVAVNKQSRTADGCCPPAWGLGGGRISPYSKVLKHYNCYTGQGTWADSFERPKVQKMDKGFETWNVKSLYGLRS
jgi:hypothetical protein